MPRSVRLLLWCVVVANVQHFAAFLVHVWATRRSRQRVVEDVESVLYCVAHAGWSSR